MFDAIDEGVFEVVVAGDGDEVTGGELGHVAGAGFSEGFVLGVEGDFVAIDEGVVGAGFGEEFDDEGDGIDEHEEEGEGDVGIECEFPALVAGLEEVVEGEGLGEDVLTRFGADGGEALGFLCVHVGELGLGEAELFEAGVDFEFDGFAEGVLLSDELFGLVAFDFLAEGGDAFGFGFVGEFDFCEFGLEEADGTGFGFAGLGLEHGFFSGEVFEQGADAFGFLAARFQLVIANGAGARAFTGEAGALAVEFAFEFGLPEGEFGLEGGVLGVEFVELFLDDIESGLEGGGGFGGGGFEFLLLCCGEAGDGGIGGVVFLEDEFGLKGFVPALALGCDGVFEGGDLVADFIFFGVEAGADDFDFGGSVGFDDGGDGIAEEEEDEGVSDGDAHEDGDDEAEGELAHFPEEGLVGAVSGEEGAVDGEDDERPDSGDGVDDTGAISDGGEGVGTGDEGEGAGDKDGGTEGDVFALFPDGAAFEGFGSGGGEPEEDAFHGAVHNRIDTCEFFGYSKRNFNPNP